MKKNSSVYILKYAGMAFQMAAIMTIAVFGGKYLDRYFNVSFPFLRLFLSFSEPLRLFIYL